MFLASMHPKRMIRRASAAILAFGLAAGLPAAAASACGVMTGEGRIVEGTERAELKLEDGRTLRLAGLDAPRPELALDRIAEAWVGKTLRIALLAPAADRWGRWLADLQGLDGSSLSDDFLRAGVARVKPEFETRNCESARLEAERVARAARIGLWGEAGAVLSADDADALAAAEGRFVVVEGRITRVGVGRSRFYLDFGGRGGFTVVVLRKAEAAFQRRGLALAALSGQSLRARGVLDHRFGPRIELADPLMIERTEGTGGSGPGG
jgi:endonuclease YncB( thermonuclease family)